jgi:hypothetical protein
VIPSDLRAAAYESNSECAWNRSDALRIIDILSENGYVVLSVDIWLPTDPGPTIPTPFVYDWTLCADAPSREYPKTAKDFIRTFEWDPADNSHQGMQPYFNIAQGNTANAWPQDRRQEPDLELRNYGDRNYGDSALNLPSWETIAGSPYHINCTVTVIRNDFTVDWHSTLAPIGALLSSAAVARSAVRA